MKIRIRFFKTGAMKFIGHLDIMRYFQKAMRRANIPISYTQGFSPHPIMSFASPLGMGLTSQGEYMDIEVSDSESSLKMMERLNYVMAEGIGILSWHRLPDGEKTNAMALVTAASYHLTLTQTGINVLSTIDISVLPKKWNAFLSQESIPVTRKTKKNELCVDIRPLIYASHWDNHELTLLLSAGSVNNIKPESVMQSFFFYMGINMPDFALNICRLDMYTGTSDHLISLNDLGEEI